MLKTASKSSRRYLPVALILLSACTFGLPSDKALIKRFDQNHQDFEQLAKTFELPENEQTQLPLKLQNLQNITFKEKAELLDKLYIQSANKNSRIGEKLDVVYLEVAYGGSGMAFSWAEKGYAYMLEKPKNTVERPFWTTENLDSYNRELSGGDALWFRPIRENWYLYFFRGQN